MTTSNGNIGTNGAAEKILVVDLGKRQSKKRIKNLREGHGKLFDKVLETITELRSDGTLDPATKPVVIVVRERAKSANLFKF